MSMRSFAIAAGMVLLTVSSMAQGQAPARGGAPSQEAAPGSVLLGPRGIVPITQRLPQATMHGTIMEITCFRSMGAASITTPDHVTCAKAALAKGTGIVGILTDGAGTFQIAGSLTANNYAKLTQFLGKEVDVVGSEVYVSNNFSYHVFEPKTMTLAKK
jgi:hypothetical protein